MSLAGRTWFVTGASAGFGKAIVREVLARGGNAVAAARSPADVEELVAIAPDRVLAAKLDVTEAGEIDASVQAALGRFGAIDVLVNNAGYGFLSAIEEAGDDQVRHQFEVNLFGPAALMRAVLPGMRARRSGFVVNVSSTAGTRGFPGSGYYSGSKAALEALTESLAKEAATLGIRALIVEPGPFRTDFFGRSIRMPAREIGDYEAAVATRKMNVAADGQQRGDPARAARIIVDTVTSADPPMRLILGGRAYDTATQAFRDKLTDMERSRDLAAQADFPEGE